MKPDLRHVLLDGAFVVLPAGAVVLLVLGLLARLQDAATPFAGRFTHPVLAAVVLLVLLCLLVGILVQSAAGRRARRAAEAALLEKLPGYRLVRALAEEAPLAGEGGRVLRPALAAIKDGQCPAVVMDSFADGRLLVFIPGCPAPISGTLRIIAPERVTLLDVPLLPFMRAISGWGLGLREMVQADAGAGAPAHAQAGRATRRRAGGA